MERKGDIHIFSFSVLADAGQTVAHTCLLNHLYELMQKARQSGKPCSGVDPQETWKLQISYKHADGMEELHSLLGPGVHTATLLSMLVALTNPVPLD